MDIKKSVLATLGILVLAVGIGIGVYLVSQTQMFRQKAAPATSIFISPTTQEAQIGKDASIFIKMNANNNLITGVDLRLSFDPNIFEVVSLEKGASIGNLNVIMSSVYDNNAGTIKYIAYTTDATKTITGNDLEVLRVNLKSKTSANPATYTITIEENTAASGLGEIQNVITSYALGSIALVTSDAVGSNNQGEPNKCGGTCGSNYNCAMNYFCYQGFCRNPVCKEDSNCDCVTATTTSTTKSSSVATKTATPKSTSISKGGLGGTQTDSPKVTYSPVSTLSYGQDEDMTRDGEADSADTFAFDFKLIVLILGILIGLYLLYKGIKSLKKDKGNPPMINLNEPQTFNDTVQTSQ